MKTIFSMKRFFILVSLVAVMVSFLSVATSNSTSKASAFGFCAPFGSSTSQKTVKGDASSSNADATNRKWTAEELFRKSVGFTSFYGEGEGTFFYAEKKDRGKDRVGWSSDVQNKFEETRSMSCMAGGFDFVPQGFLGLSSGITSLTGALIVSLVGKDMMADTISKILGGGDSDGGLIETFYNSFYSPLVVIVFIFMACVIIYKGLVKRQLRESIGMILWSVGAFALGVILLTNPKILVGAPQAATSTITSCVIGSLSGQNCLSGDVATPSILSGNECVATVNGSKGKGAESVVTGMNCTIWKAFVLEPWAEEQFGEPYKNLYTANAPKGGKIWSNLPKDSGEKYCVNLGSKKSIVASNGNPSMDYDGYRICNVALYQLFIKTQMQDPVAQSGNNYNSKGVMKSDDTGKYDSRWYDIANPMATDASKWRNWSGDGAFFSRLGTSILSLIAVVAASSVLLTLAIFGGAYKMIALILIAFAPIFLLFAIEPTRGKRIFLGWLESAVSSILKYFAITILIVVALVMYAGLLSNTSGMFSLIGVLLMTVALQMYRKEIVNLIGASNMGGQKLSNKFKENSPKFKGLKDKATAAVGGFIGGGAATAMDEGRRERMKQRNENISNLRKALKEAETPEEKAQINERINEEQEAKKEEDSVVGSALSGAGASTARAMKRGQGVTSQAFRQAGRTSQEMKKKAEIDKASSQNIASELGKAALPALDDEENVVLEANSPTEADSSKFANVQALRDNVRVPVALEGDLTSGEKEELAKFADDLRLNTSDQLLAEMASDENIVNDPNKRNFVAQEINARLQSNTMLGVASNALSRTPLSNQMNVSDEELQLNVQLHAEDYLESGKSEDLKKYLESGKELATRLNIEFDENQAEAKMTEFRNNFNGEYTRNESIPNTAELDARDSFDISLNENLSVKSDSVTAPATMAQAIASNRDAIEAVNSNGSNNNQSPTGEVESEIKAPKKNDDDDDNPKGPGGGGSPVPRTPNQGGGGPTPSNEQEISMPPIDDIQDSFVGPNRDNNQGSPTSVSNSANRVAGVNDNERPNVTTSETPTPKRAEPSRMAREIDNYSSNEREVGPNNNQDVTPTSTANSTRRETEIDNYSSNEREIGPNNNQDVTPTSTANSTRREIGNQVNERPNVTTSETPTPKRAEPSRMAREMDNAIADALIQNTVGVPFPSENTRNENVPLNRNSTPRPNRRDEEDPLDDMLSDFLNDGK